MYSLLSKKIQNLMLSSGVRVLAQSKPQLGFFQCIETSQQPTVRFFSTSLEAKQSFTASYLINSCGLSLEKASSISKKVHFETPTRPDSVLMLLRNYGFSNTHITKLLMKHPRVLLANPEKTLRPKFEFLHSFGISINDIAKMVSFDPSFLKRSLENRLVPLYNFLKNILCDDEKVAKIFRRLRREISNTNPKRFVPNFEVLRQLGVPESSIFLALTSLPNVVLQDHDKFVRLIKEVTSIGCDPKKSQFFWAMHVFYSLSKSTLEHKMWVYKRWRWSEKDIQLALKNYPICMCISEKNIMGTMDFLVNQMGCKSADIARYPITLMYNLENRIVPRCLVIKLLLLKGLLKREVSLASVINCSEKQFLGKFVTRYNLEDIPLILNVYQGKTSLLELGFSSDEVRGVKPL